jgi:hypothetical protein
MWQAKQPLERNVLSDLGEQLEEAVFALVPRTLGKEHQTFLINHLADGGKNN